MSTPAWSDERAAVERFIRRRDEASFVPIFRAHTPMLLMLAMRLVGGSRADAEDAVQEAWMRAVPALPRFAWRSSLRTWLCGFVVNCCRELRRRPAPMATIALVAAPSDTNLDLERAVAALPEGAREVFLLHDIHGHTHEEVAGILGIEAGTSKSQLHHARHALRAFLGESDDRATDQS